MDRSLDPIFQLDQILSPTSVPRLQLQITADHPVGIGPDPGEPLQQPSRPPLIQAQPGTVSSDDLVGCGPFTSFPPLPTFPSPRSFARGSLFRKRPARDSSHKC